MVRSRDEPSVGHRYDASTIFGNMQESGLSQIKVLERGIAPAAIVVRELVVRWAEVGGSDGDGAHKTPFGVINAPQLVAGTTVGALVEQSSAQCCSVCAVAIAVQVAITTCPSCIRKSPIHQRYF